MSIFKSVSEIEFPCLHRGSSNSIEILSKKYYLILELDEVLTHLKARNIAKNLTR